MQRQEQASSWRIADRVVHSWAVVVFLIVLPVFALAFPIIDITGWWTDSEGLTIEIRQQQANITVYDVWGTLAAEGAVSNDTVFMFVEGDTLVFVYSDGTLVGTDPDGRPITLIRSVGGPEWMEAGCRTITVDGQTSDWSGIAPTVDDANNDATGNPSTEIDKVYVSRDNQYLYLRIDIIGPANPQHSGHQQDRYSFELRGPEGHFEISFSTGYPILIRDIGADEEWFLEPFGLSEHTVEGRIPLIMLNGLERAELLLGTWYWHSENEEGYFDFSRCLVTFGPCTPCGDLDGSGQILVSDVFYFVDWLFAGGPTPQDGSGGDLNCDLRTNVADVVYLVRYIYAGGPNPCAGCR